MAKPFNSKFPKKPGSGSFADSDDPAIAQLRVPPHSMEAEQSVLGGLLLDNAAFDKIADLVGEADFYRDEHTRIYRPDPPPARTRQAGRRGYGGREPRPRRRVGRDRRPRLPRRIGGQHAVGGETSGVMPRSCRATGRSCANW